MTKSGLTVVAGATLLLAGAARSASADDFSAVNAGTATVVTVAVPAGPLDVALESLARQTGIDVVYPSGQLKGMTTPGISGTLDAHQAFARLLEGTPLVMRDQGKSIFVSLPKTGAASTPTADSAPSGTTGELRLAQAEPATTTGSDRPERVEPGRVEEIVVTAQKREERLQDVPMAVTVVSGQSLLATNQPGLTDFYARIPGMNVQSAGLEQGAIVTLRGLTNGGFSSPLVAVTVDDLPFTSATTNGGGIFATDIDPGDVAQIEVLRGPQGTLYGANSLGGLIKYTTIDPSSEEMEGRLEGSVVGVQHGNDAGYSARGSVNMPLSDTFGLRASGFGRRDPGFIDDPQHDRTDVNSANVYGGRLAGLWQASERLSLKLSAMLQDRKVHGDSYAQLGPGFEELEHSELDGTGTIHVKFQIYSATMKAKLGSTNLTSLSAYSNNTFLGKTDFSGIPFFSNTALANFGVPFVMLRNDHANRKFTQELRLASTTDQKLEWLLGAFYTHESSDYDQQDPVIDAATGEQLGSLGRFVFPSTYEEYAAFADLTVHFGDRFDVQFGGRESHNKQSYQETDSGILVGNTTIVGPTIHSNDSVFTYLVTPRFKLNPDLMIYARFASGYRPGGPNSNGGLTTPQGSVPRQYGADKTENYEVGIKGSALARAFSYDASLYRIDWKNLQLSFFDGFSFYGNGGEARSQGLEFSVQARPWTGLVVDSWVTFSDAKLSEDVPPAAVAAGLYGQSGDRLPFSSRFSGYLSLQQEFALAGEWRGFAGGSLTYVGERKGTFVSAATFPRLNLPGYTQVDLLAGMRNDAWTLNLALNNVADRRGTLEGNPAVSSSIYYITPRRISLSLSRAF